MATVVTNDVMTSQSEERASSRTASRRDRLTRLPAPEHQTSPAQSTSTLDANTKDTLGDRRIRRFHLRSRKGCSQCKIRKVRCDERKPVCGRCEKRDVVELCNYPQAALSTSASHSSPTGTAGPSTAAASSNERMIATTGPPSNAFPGSQYVHPEHVQTGSSYQSLDTQANSDTGFSTWAPSTQMSQAAINSLFLPPGALLAGFDLSQQQFPYPTNPTGSLGLLHPGTQLQDTTYLLTQPSSHDTNLLPEINWIFGNDESPDSSHVSQDARPEQSSSCNFSGQSSRISTPAPGLSLEPTIESTWTIVSSNLCPAVVECSSYLLLQDILGREDGLIPFFPIMEQRHQFRHFINHTSRSLLGSTKIPAENPFLCHLSHLVLRAHSGQRVAHDALRYALLSLASIDMGIKMDHKSDPMSDNALYDISNDQRSEAYSMLRACCVSGVWKEDVEATDVAIAAVVALSFRDRLAGSQVWEQPLELGRDILTYFGGPGPFIASHPTADRRFLVEQMAIIDLVGSLTTMNRPMIFTWDSEWFTAHYTAGAGGDHVQDVYGWTREAVMWAARTMLLFGEARDIDSMRRAEPKTNHKELRDIVQSRSIILHQRVRDMIPQGDTIQQESKELNLRPEVMTGVTSLTTTMEIFMRTIILRENITMVVVRKLVEKVFDVSEASIARGHYSGLLLPLNLVDGVVQESAVHKSRAKAILTSLRGRYHAVPEYLEKIISMDWASFATIHMADFGQHLREIGYYILCL